MLRHRRLGDRELGLDHRADRAGALLTLGKQLQDPAPDRIPENIERVHSRSIPTLTYISQG